MPEHGRRYRSRAGLPYAVACSPFPGGLGRASRALFAAACIDAVALSLSAVSLITVRYGRSQPAGRALFTAARIGLSRSVFLSGKPCPVTRMLTSIPGNVRCGGPAAYGCLLSLSGGPAVLPLTAAYSRSRAGRTLPCGQRSPNRRSQTRTTIPTVRDTRRQATEAA